MDTRSKVLNWAAAGEALGKRAKRKTPGVVVVGYFDPLLASHVRRLEEIGAGQKLFVVVTSPAKPLLAAEARAELVAALESVENVVVAPADRLQDLLRLAPAGSLVLDQASDAARTGELIRHVHARQTA